MGFVKALHFLCVFVWVGNLLSLTRLMGYLIKEDENTQMRMAKIYRRMYSFVGLPTMVLGIIFGIVLWINLDLSYKPGWFHMKLTFVAGLIACDLICGRHIRQLNLEPQFGKGVKFKILHGMVGLMLIGVIASGSIVRDRTGEIKYRIDKAITSQGVVMEGSSRELSGINQ